MGTDFKIAWRSIWRNPRRSLLTMAALAFSSLLLVFMASWQHGAYQAMIQSAVGLQTGPLQVLAADYQKNPDMRKVIRNADALIRRIRALPDVASAAPRGEAFCLVSSDTRSAGVSVIGMDPLREKGITTIEKTLRKGRFIGRSGDETVIGSRLASNLRVAVGDTLVVLGQAYDGATAAHVVTVVGIVETGQAELDRSLMIVPFSMFQQTFDISGMAHRILVEPKSFEELQTVRAEVSNLLPKQNPALEAATWDTLIPGLKEGITLDQVSAYMIYAILMIVVTFSIANTFFMAVLERVREFGILRAIGTTSARLSRMVLLETSFLAGMGILCGLILGIGVTLLVQRVGIPVGEAGSIMKEYGMPDRLYTKLSWITAFAGPAFVLAITMIAAILPVLRIRKLKVAEALAER